MIVSIVYITNMVVRRTTISNISIKTHQNPGSPLISKTVASTNGGCIQTPIYESNRIRLYDHAYGPCSGIINASGYRITEERIPGSGIHIATKIQCAGRNVTST